MSTNPNLTAPFSYFGGKRRIASVIWDHIGDVRHYAEPFAGSLAVLLARPHEPRCETVNDINACLVNFWRAVRSDPLGVAEVMSEAKSEVELVARNNWLIGQVDRLRTQMTMDPEWYDLTAAARWGYVAKNWLASGMVQKPVVRKLPNLGNAHYGHQIEKLEPWLLALACRLREVRIACGSWERILSPAILNGIGYPCGIVLDPPYSTDVCDDVYATGSVAGDVRDWCLANGGRAELRVALCGYRHEGHAVLEDHGWTRHDWVAHGGFGCHGQGRGRKNREMEAIWFSPGCQGT